MRNRADEIKRILDEATKAAYERGWNDALRAFAQAANAPAPTDLFHQDVKPANVTVGRGRPPKAADAVRMVVTATPGQSGAFIAAQLPEIPERTVRTALRRLRVRGQIDQRNGGWFLKHVSGA